MAEKEGVHTGRCRFCGQVQEVIAGSQKEADEITTKGCSCDEGQRYDDYEKMMRYIELTVGGPCTEAGFTPLEEREKSMIREVAELIFRKRIGKATFAFDGSQITLKQTEKSAKISRKKVEQIAFE